MGKDTLQWICNMEDNRTHWINDSSQAGGGELYFVKNRSCVESLYVLLMAGMSGDFDIPTWEYVSYSVGYILASLLGIFGNGLVIFVVFRNKAMRTKRNVLITNLAISNLALGLILYPLLWIPSHQMHWVYGRFFCKVVNALPGFNIYCSTLTISVMSMDRYYTVVSTRTGGGRERRGVALAWAALIWLTAILFNVPLMIFYDTMPMPKPWQKVVLSPNLEVSTEFSVPVCSFPANMDTEEDAEMKMIISFSVSMTQLLFLYVVPIIVLLYYNYRLTSFLRRNASQLTTTRAVATEEPSELQGRTSSEVGSRPPVPSAAMKRQSPMAASYALLMLPYTVMSLLLDLELVTSQRRLDRLAKFISVLSICVNPFLYGYLNTNFNREFKKILASLPSVRGLRSSDSDVGTTTNGLTVALQLEEGSCLIRPPHSNGLSPTSPVR